jgi:hypothetical protein
MTGLDQSEMPQHVSDGGRFRRKRPSKRLARRGSAQERAYRNCRRDKAINAIFANPKVKARLADLGGMALPGSPADFGNLIADQTEKWGKVVKFAGIRPE